MPFALWLSLVKDRLATVKTTSLRYRLAEMIWHDRVDRSKACTFYWLMLPSSTIALGCGCIILAAAIVIFGSIFLVITAITWVFGFVPAIWADKQQRFGSRRNFYPYKYAPLKGDFRRVAPWQVLGPIAVLGGVGYLAVTNRLGPLFSMGGGWLNDNWRWLVLVGGAIAGVIIVCYLVGLLVRSQLRRRLGEEWGKVCPPLHVVVEPEKSEQAA